MLLLLIVVKFYDLSFCISLALKNVHVLAIMTFLLHHDYGKNAHPRARLIRSIMNVAFNLNRIINY